MMSYLDLMQPRKNPLLTWSSLHVLSLQVLSLQGLLLHVLSPHFLSLHSMFHHSTPFHVLSYAEWNRKHFTPRWSLQLTSMIPNSWPSNWSQTTTCGFIPDTGAQYNVIPVNLHKNATKDCSLKRVTPLNTQLAAYGGLKTASCGSSAITVWCDDLKCKLDCKLVEKSAIRPLLGRKACVVVKIIKYTDNDELSKLQTGNTPVYSLERVTMEKVKPVPITREELIEKYPDVFGDGVGKFALNTKSDWITL